MELESTSETDSAEFNEHSDSNYDLSAENSFHRESDDARVNTMESHHAVVTDFAEPGNEFSYASNEATENISSRGRKKVLNITKHKSFIKKKLVERGEVHKTKSGRTIAAKIFDPQTSCRCKNKCADNIDVLRQQEIFKHYYNSSNWSNKTVFIRSNVCRHQVKCRKSDKNPIIPLKTKSYIFEYSLTDGNGIRHKVCRSFFVKLLRRISEYRIRNALRTECENPNAVDRRGKGPSKNKTNFLDLQFLKEFINKFPRYESHYCRSRTNTKYLAPYLTLAKMYREYKTLCEFQQRPALSEFIIRRTFNYDFNLAFKRRKTDTCKRCDELKVRQRTHDVSKQIEKHDESVVKVKTKFSNDIALGRSSDEKIQCFTFYLQKALASLETNINYYKRQLWTYNLCVYDEIHQVAYMYIWSENIASRGAQEIGSALLYHFKHHLPTATEQIILYSDSCGSQNRNIKLTLMLKKFLVISERILKIEQNFFIPGHSYNSCDRCFGLIERQKKSTENIFCPQHWINLIKQSKKSAPKFVVTELCEEDFFSSQAQEKLIKNRRDTVDKQKINWFKIRRIVNMASDPFVLEVEMNNDTHTENPD